MTGDLARLRQSYCVGFLRYLSRRDELTLHTAYELGRRGLVSGVSLLDLVQIHHAVLVDTLSEGSIAILRVVTIVLLCTAAFCACRSVPFCRSAMPIASSNVIFGLVACCAPATSASMNMVATK